MVKGRTREEEARESEEKRGPRECMAKLAGFCRQEREREAYEVKFRGQGGMRGAERSQEASMDSVTGS